MQSGLVGKPAHRGDRLARPRGGLKIDPSLLSLSFPSLLCVLPVSVVKKSGGEAPPHLMGDIGSPVSPMFPVGVGPPAPLQGAVFLGRDPRVPLRFTRG